MGGVFKGVLRGIVRVVKGGTQQAQPVAREALLKHAGGKAASKTSTRASKTSTRASGIASQQATPTNSEIQNSAGKGQLDFRTAYIRNELYLEEASGFGEEASGFEGGASTVSMCRK